MTNIVAVLNNLRHIGGVIDMTSANVYMVIVNSMQMNDEPNCTWSCQCKNYPRLIDKANKDFVKQTRRTIHVNGVLKVRDMTCSITFTQLHIFRSFRSNVRANKKNWLISQKVDLQCDWLGKHRLYVHKHFHS